MQKGVALLLAIIILTAVLAIALTAGRVMVDKIKMSRNTGDSVKAYYAAESRIECELYKLKYPEKETDCNIPNTEVEIGEDYIKAIGKAGNTKRGIEVALAQAEQGCYVDYTGSCGWGTEVADLGTWGFCNNADQGFFSPPGGDFCSNMVYNIKGTAKLCCQ